MEEVEEVPIVASPTPAEATSVPTSTASIVAPTTVPVEEFESAAEFSLLQKSLFFGVIVGCIVVYMRMTNKKGRRFQEKSLA
jgi:hypothetical protein